MSTLDRLLTRSELFQFWRLFSGRAAPEAGPVVLSQRRVYILPTRHGYTFAIALALMLTGSINYQLSLGYILTFLLAGMGVVSILHTYRNLAHIAVSAGRLEPAFAGSTVRCHLHFDNPTNFDRVSVEASCGGARAVCDVPAHAAATVVLMLPAERRGWFRMPRVTVETHYPVGLLRAWSYVLPDASALVYPKPEESALPQPAATPDRGDAALAGTGNDDYWGLRPYQPSDSPRHIAWKAAAREGTLLTKVFVGLGAFELWLDWNALSGAAGVEQRLSLLTHQVLAAEDANVAYGLRLPGCELGPAFGESHRDACLKALALFDGRRT
ncbi:MAG TPA: DUF58 domain-containing protein [Burkholderiales bacterium]|nr:DUF58 domain-containing protein [Burkholderiales bacterium]